MSSSNLIRWGGLAAVVAGILSVIADLIVLFVLGFGQNPGVFTSLGLLFRSLVGPVAVALLLLGLVGLYARQSELAGLPGLISFLVAFFGTVLAQSFLWANLLASLGWALFGVSCLRAGVYPRIACILLIVGAVSLGAVSALISGAGSILMHVAGAGADTVLNVAIAWLGFSLFRRRIAARWL